MSGGATSFTNILFAILVDGEIKGVSNWRAATPKMTNSMEV
jgi:hypothetical protein